MIRNDGSNALSAKLKTVEQTVETTRQKPTLVSTDHGSQLEAKPLTSKPPAKLPSKPPHTTDERVDRRLHEPKTQGSAVLAKSGEKRSAGQTHLDVRLRAAERNKDLITKKLGTKTPTEARPDKSDEERLSALLVRGPTGHEPVDLDDAVKLMREKLGPKGAFLSHQEVADAIGLPKSAGHLKKLGELGLLDATHGEAPHFRLAASLARWMERLDFGATRAEVVASFFATHPHVAEMAPHLDGDFLAVLQRAYPFMPQWDRKPTGLAPSPKGIDALMPTAAESVRRDLMNALDKVAEIPLALPLTNGVAVGLEREQAFAGHNVVMVQHMLGQAVPFVESMTKAGMDVSKVEYVGIPYQENATVGVTLEKTFGLPVTVPERGDIDGMWAAVCAAVDRAYERHLQNGEPILILDDGGYASKYICEKYKDQQHLFKVVEQTTRGLTEIAKLDPQFPIGNVAGSHGKRFESNQIGDVVVHAVRKVLDVVSTTPARKPVLVVGAGKVGAAVAESFKGDGAKVTIFDPFITKKRKAELEKRGFTVITDKAAALNGKFLVVGCSGHRSIDMNDFVKLSSPVFMASASSKRVEIDTLGLGELSTDQQGQLRRVLAAKVGEQETWHYWLKDGRIITMMADGLPVNFQGVNSVAPELIDHTMALMLLAAGQIAKLKDGPHRPEGLVELDHDHQWRLQMKMDGVREDKESDRDIRLELFGRPCFATRAQWLDVARSPATPPEVVLEMYRTFSKIDPLDPVALECLGSQHDAHHELIDAVARANILPHVARMLNHESIGVNEQDRLLATLALAAEDLIAGTFVGALGALPVAVEIDERAGIQSRRFDPNHFEQLPNGALLIKRNESSPTKQASSVYGDPLDADEGWSQVRERVLGQLSAILLTHPRAPDHVVSTFYVAKLPSTIGQVRASNVHAIRRSPWTPEMVKRMYDVALPQLRKIPQDRRHAGVDGEIVSTEQRARYVFDVLDAFADHPHCPPAVRKAIAGEMMQLLAWVGDRFELTSPERWPISPALGIPLPEYR